MIDQYFRSILPRFVEPIVCLYIKLGLHPNHLTITGFVCSLIAAALIVQNMPWLAFGMWWLGRFFDGTDGILARRTKQTSNFGAHLDILLDMASYSVMVLAFQRLYPELSTTWIAIMALYVLCITGALSFGILQDAESIPGDDNRGLRLASGLAEAGETGIAYSVFLIFPAWIHITAILWLCVLSITVIARLYLASVSLSR